MRPISALLWIDSGAALTVGVLVLSFAPWLSRLYGLPNAVVIGMGVANVAYGIYSFSLARRQTRPRSLLLLLVIGNATWAVLCMIAAAVASYATRLGLAQLLLESVFVGGLAALEWRHREVLSAAT